MKKRILSLFLAAAISVASMTAPAFASDTKIWQEQMEPEQMEPEQNEEIQQEQIQQTAGQDMETEGNIPEIPQTEKCFEVQTEIEHGQLNFADNRTSFCEGEVVEFSIAASEGYLIQEVNAASEEGKLEIQNYGEALYRFVMPAGNVSICAVLLPKQDESEISAGSDSAEQENFFMEDSEEAGEEIGDNFDLAVFHEENAALMEAETPEEEKLVEEIKEGEVIALAPLENVTMENTAMAIQEADEGLVSMAAGTSPFTVRLREYMNMDEVWVNNGTATHHLGTAYREIVYTDDDGEKHVSPIYCLNASKNGPMSSSMTIREEAIKILSNSSLKKILYYGYGGPGDICSTYDPTCSHCDWSKKTNRYVLTHMALSKIYANDVSGATAAECEHVGLNRWISKLTSLAFPNMKDLKFYGKDSNGDTVSTKDMVGNLTYYRVVPESLSWAGMKDGVQISGIYKLTSALDKNGIRFSRGTSDNWVMGYWKNEEDYTTRGSGNPRILGKGKSVTLYKGARIRYAFPRTVAANQKLSFVSILKPVEYIVINSSIQLNQSNMQDLGAYYYEGQREQLSLTLRPAPSGTVVLKKTADHDPDIRIEGAGYQLKAAENIVSNGTTVLKKDEKVDENYTDKNGEITFSYIPAGKYYFVETEAKEGTEAEKYLTDATKYSVTVTKASSKTITVQEIPDMRGKVSIRKVIGGTELNLEGAEFTLYFWSKSSNKYTNGVKLQYDASVKRYVSEPFAYTSDNQGKFMVEETKNPNGFTGAFRREFVLTKLAQEELFEFKAENTASPRRVEITKVDSVTREILEDAEFTIYEWDNISQAYKDIGELLTFHKETGRYYSKVLEITDRNAGRYKVEETRIPEGYTGKFVKEINLYDGNAEVQFTAENTPDTPVTGRIRIKKTDSVKGTVLTDAEFTVYQYNIAAGKYEDTLGDFSKLSFDEKSRLYLSKELAINKSNGGKFKVVETKSPAGYHGSWEKEFVLTEDDPELPAFEVTNDPDRPPLTELTVIKKIKESEILWAHGNPVFFFVAEGKDEKGFSRKYENYISFSPGGYSVDANGYATLQITFRDVPAGQYQVYEKPVLYYYLEDSIANTRNVSIVKGKSPAYGIRPREIAYGSIRLTASENKASITFVNKKGRYDHYIHNDVVKNRIPIVFQ